MIASDFWCLHPDCDKRQHCRGLCKTHHVSALRAIRKGQGSEEDLIERGLLRPKLGDIFRHGSKVKGREKQ